MKTFRFSLEAVLTLREQEERAKLKACVQARRAHAAAAAQLRQAERAIDLARSQHQQAVERGIDAGELQQFRAYFALLEQRRRRLAHALLMADDALREAESEFQLARLQREMVESCRRHQRARYDAEGRRLAQKETDEVASRCVPLLSTGHALSEFYDTPA